MWRCAATALMLGLGCGDVAPVSVATDDNGRPDASFFPDGGTVPDEISDFLSSVDGLAVEERESEIAGYRFFVLQYRQPSPCLY